MFLILKRIVFITQKETQKLPITLVKEVTIIK